MVNSLARKPEYVGKTLWLEHDVDDATDTRRAMWWNRNRVDNPSASSATTPLILVDGGRTYADGKAQPFEAKYRALVDTALGEPALVAIEAYQEREAGTNRLRVHGNITNISEMTFGYDNEAKLWIMAYEQKAVIHVDWFVRKVMSVALDDDLAPGQKAPFDQTITLPAGSAMSAAETVVMLEYKAANGAMWSANAAISSKITPSPPPPNDKLLDYIFVEPLPFTDTKDTRWATDDEGEVHASCSTGAEHGIWYLFEPNDDMTLDIDTVGSDYNTVLSIWTSENGQHPMTEMACNDDADDQLAKLRQSFDGGGSYYIKLGGASGAAGKSVINARAVGIFPPTVVPTTPAVPPTTVAPPTPVPTTVEPPTVTPVPTIVPPERFYIFMPLAGKNFGA